MEAVKLAYAALNAAVHGGVLLSVRSFAMIAVVTLAEPLPILPIVAVHVSGPCVQPFQNGTRLARRRTTQAGEPCQLAAQLRQIGEFALDLGQFRLRQM